MCAGQKLGPTLQTPELAIRSMPGHLIRRLHQASVAMFDNETRHAGLDLTPVQFAALSMIESEPGVDQATLAQTIGYDRVTIGGVVDRLEAKGLVHRAIDSADRRARRLTLSDAGVDVLAQAMPVVRKVQGDILQGLSAQESAAFCALLHKALLAVGDITRTPGKAK